MLTAVRRRLGLTHEAFVPFARRHGLIRFLFANHELLHYYDNDYVVDDVLDAISQRKGDGLEPPTAR